MWRRVALFVHVWARGQLAHTLWPDSSSGAAQMKRSLVGDVATEHVEAVAGHADRNTDGSEAVNASEERGEHDFGLATRVYRHRQLSLPAEARHSVAIVLIGVVGQNMTQDLHDLGEVSLQDFEMRHQRLSIALSRVLQNSYVDGDFAVAEGCDAGLVGPIDNVVACAGVRRLRLAALHEQRGRAASVRRC